MPQQTSAFDWQVVKTTIDHRAVSSYFKNNFLCISRTFGALKQGNMFLKIKMPSIIYLLIFICHC